MNLINTFRSLWEQHVEWTRMVIISMAENLPDVNLVTNRLLRNPQDMANVIAQYYGPQNASTFQRLLTEHLSIAADLVNAAKANDTMRAQEAERKWYQNADQIVDFLSSINPYWSKQELHNMFYEHLALTKSEAVERLHKNYANDIALYDRIEALALRMADTFSQGIIRQFPKKF